MQFNDAFAQVIRVKSNATIKHFPATGKTVPPDLIRDFCHRSARLFANACQRARLSIRSTTLFAQFCTSDVQHPPSRRTKANESTVDSEITPFSWRRCAAWRDIITRVVSGMLIGAIAYYDDHAGRHELARNSAGGRNYILISRLNASRLLKSTR